MELEDGKKLDKNNQGKMKIVACRKEMIMQEMVKEMSDINQTKIEKIENKKRSDSLASATKMSETEKKSPLHPLIAKAP